MEKYIHNEVMTEGFIIKHLRRATINSGLVPVLCGSSLKNTGIQPLLDAICDYLPSPVEVPPMIGINPNTEAEEERKIAKQQRKMEREVSKTLDVISDTTEVIRPAKLHGELEKSDQARRNRLEKRWKPIETPRKPKKFIYITLFLVILVGFFLTKNLFSGSNKQK